MAEKTAYALDNGLKVCLCVGETLEERERNETGAVVARQTAAVACWQMSFTLSILQSSF